LSLLRATRIPRGSAGKTNSQKSEILKSEKPTEFNVQLIQEIFENILMRATRITRGSHGKIILKSQKFSKVGSLLNVLYSITIEKTFENVLDAGDEDVMYKIIVQLTFDTVLDTGQS